MSKFRLLWAFLLVAGVLGARTVRVENVICNPEAEVVVPVTLDDAQGLSVVSLILNYNAEVLTLTDVDQGDLKDVFSFDFTVVDDTPGQVEIISVSPADITDSVGGTLALLRFDVRKGTEEMYSDIALADVTFYEETMTVDMTDSSTTQPKGGMVRAFGKTANCHSRQGEDRLTIAPGTMLKQLTLLENDTIQVAANAPVVITETLTTEGTIKLAAPTGGWTPGRYSVIRLPKAKARAAVDFVLAEASNNLKHTISYVEADEYTDYTVEISDGTVLARVGETCYYTIDSIPKGTKVVLSEVSALITETNTIVTTKDGRHLGREGQEIADVLGGSFTATKESGDSGPTTLTYDYDLGIVGMEAVDGNIEVILGLKEFGNAPDNDNRVLTNRTVALSVTLGDGTTKTYTSNEETPIFTKEDTHNAATYRIRVPYEDFKQGTNAIKMSIRK